MQAGRSPIMGKPKRASSTSANGTNEGIDLELLSPTTPLGALAGGGAAPRL
jgi:hypothetical protein